MSNWFDNGINTISGAIRYTQVEDGPLDKKVITRLGSYFVLDICGVNNEVIERPMFTTKSKTRIKSRATVGSNQDVWYCLRPQNLVREYYSVDDIDDAVTVTYVVSNNTQTGITLETFNEDTKEFNEPIVLNTFTYGGLKGRLPYTYATGTVVDMWANMYGLNNSQGDNNYAWSRTSPTGKGVMYCLINNTETQRIEAYIIQDGFAYGTSHGQGTVYEDTVLGRMLFYITYEQLNNPNYFDPEQDSAEPWGDFQNDTSKPGGGVGVYGNYPSEDMDFPELPGVSALDTGFITAYAPTATSLQSLVNYLWTSDWLEVVKKMINNPMDAIISLQLLPYTVWELAIPSTCKIGAVNTGITMDKLNGQYKILDCGSVQIPENWGNALDYTNVKIAIFLPFIGVRTIDTDIAMNSTIQCKYYVDILTGVGIAMLKCSKNNSSKSVYYTYECNTNYQIPITGANFSAVISGVMGLTTTMIGTAMSGGVGASAIGTSIANASNVIGNKTTIENSGNLSSNTGILGEFVPYVIVDLPTQSLPSNFKHTRGFASNITSTLGSLSGYTEVESIDLNGIQCTEEERDAILSLLKSGVYI